MEKPIIPQSVYDKVDDEAKKQIDETLTVVSDEEFAALQVKETPKASNDEE